MKSLGLSQVLSIPAAGEVRGFGHPAKLGGC
jgi:hypothetical protein